MTIKKEKPGMLEVTRAVRTVDCGRSMGMLVKNGLMKRGVGMLEEKDLQMIAEIVGKTVEPISKDVKELKGDVAGVKEDVAELKGDVVEIKGDVAGVKEDVAGLKGEVVEIKEDVAGVKEEVAGLKGDVVEIKGDVAGVKSDVAGLKVDVAGLKVDVAGVKEDVAGLKGEVVEIKGDVAGLKWNVCELEQKFEGTVELMRKDIKELQLTLENETNRNIRIIAEGHLNLSRKLDEALKVENEKEIMSVRVNILESEVRRLRDTVTAMA